MEKTLEQLQQENATLLSNNNTLTQQLADVTDTTSKALEAHKSEIEDLKSQLTDALTANEALSAELEKVSKTETAADKKEEEKPIVLAEHSFQLDGKTYGFNYPKLTIAKSQVITPIEVKASVALQKQLIESGSSMIFEK